MQNLCAREKECDENQKKDKKPQALHTRLLSEMNAECHY